MPTDCQEPTLFFSFRSWQSVGIPIWIGIQHEENRTDVSSHDHKVVQVTNSTTWTSLGSCGNRRRAVIFVLHFIEMKWVRRNRERSVTVLESMMKDLDRFQDYNFALVFFLTHHFNEMKWVTGSTLESNVSLWHHFSNEKWSIRIKIRMGVD